MEGGELEEGRLAEEGDGGGGELKREFEEKARRRRWIDGVCVGQGRWRCDVLSQNELFGLEQQSMVDG